MVPPASGSPRSNAPSGKRTPTTSPPRPVSRSGPSGTAGDGAAPASVDAGGDERLAQAGGRLGGPPAGQPRGADGDPRGGDRGAGDEAGGRDRGPLGEEVGLRRAVEGGPARGEGRGLAGPAGRPPRRTTRLRGSPPPDDLRRWRSSPRGSCRPSPGRRSPSRPASASRAAFAASPVTPITGAAARPAGSIGSGRSRGSARRTARSPGTGRRGGLARRVVAGADQRAAAGQTAALQQLRGVGAGTGPASCAGSACGEPRRRP